MTRCRAGLIALILSFSAGLPAGAQEPPPPSEKADAAPAAEEKTEEKTTRWVYSWDGWDGLRLGLIRKTRWKNPSQVYVLAPKGPDAEPLLDFEEVKLTSRIGVRLAGDAAAFHTTGSLTDFDDGADFRRARLFLNGDWTLVVPLEYSIELGYTPNKFVLSDAWLLFPELKYVGPTKLGQFQPPQGLDVINSSWAITFMEPAAPLQALAPGTNAGIQVGRPVLDNRATWRLGIFGNGAGAKEYGLVASSYGSVIGRATWLAIQQGGSEGSPVPRFLHRRAEHEPSPHLERHHPLPVASGELHRALRHRHRRSLRAQRHDARGGGRLGERALLAAGGVSSLLGRPDGG